MADPRLPIFRIACAVVPFDRPAAIAGRDNGLLLHGFHNATCGLLVPLKSPSILCCDCLTSSFLMRCILPARIGSQFLYAFPPHQTCFLCQSPPKSSSGSPSPLISYDAPPA